MEWNLFYDSWMIADGEADHDVGESFEWFAVEFWTEEPLVKTGVRQKTAVPIADYKYRVTAEITFLSEKACVIDFGLKTIRTRDLVAPDCKVGDYVAGEISIGLPLFVEMVPESVLESLKYKWKVNGISADLTPFTPHPDNPRFLIRNITDIRYVDAKSTREVSANYHILRCTEIK